MLTYLIVTCLITCSLCHFTSFNNTRNTQQGIETYDVIIVGAGIAGIAAGKTLSENGITNFLIIEAQDFVGGRTKTANIGNLNLSLNLGASWMKFINTTEDDAYSPDTILNDVSALNHSIWERAGTINLTKQRVDDHYDITFYPFEAELYGVDENVSYLDSGFDINNYFTNINDVKWQYYSQWENMTDCIELITDYVTESNIDMSFRAMVSLCGWDKGLDRYVSKYDEFETHINQFEFDDQFSFEAPGINTSLNIDFND